MCIRDRPYITKKKLKELKEKVEYLKTTRRKEIAKRIKEAKEMGDISENAELDTANEERLFNEAEILRLENLIKNAIIIRKNKTKKDIVEVGSTVEIKMNSEKIIYTIVGPEDVDLENNKISNESPIGRVLLGRKKGEIVEADLPAGKIKIKILKIT